jgi:hypothetical protein
MITNFNFVDVGDGYTLHLKGQKSGAHEVWRWAAGYQGAIVRAMSAEEYPDQTSAHDAGVGWVNLERVNDPTSQDA